MERYPDLLQRPTRHSQSPNPDVVTLKLRDPGELPSRTVKFPSDDFSVGSIGYIWPGPKSDDLKTITALEVIHRYLADNPSSLIKKEFVEVVEPLASDIDMEVGEGLDANLVWIFSGVPRIHDGGPDDDDGLEEDSNEDDSIDEDNDDDDSIDEVEVDGSQKDEKDLFAPNFYHSKIMSHLHSITFPDYSLDMKPTLKRHAIKLLESLEDSPHETVAMAIVPEVIRNRLLKTGTLQVGRRLQIFDILKELEGEDEGFWKGLVKKFFIERSANEVMMVPDQQLAKDLAQKQVDDEKRRIKEMGKKGLKKASERVAMALEENKIDLDEADMARMPPVPSAAKAGRIPSRVEIINLCEDGSIFGSCQVVKTETAFVHLGMAINIARVPKELRSYLVLFQELLFQSPLDLITDSGLKVTMPYEEVSTHASKLFISHECGVGFGNSYFSASYLTQVLTLFVTGTPSEWELVVRFVTQVLLFSQFIKKRIISIAKNLLSSIIDVKRDGNGVLGATINRICLSNKFAEECGSNENAISIFEQERFLKGVIEKCKVYSIFKVRMVGKTK